MSIIEDIQKANLDQIGNIKNFFEKGKSMPDGTIRIWGGISYKKVGGVWVEEKKTVEKRSDLPDITEDVRKEVKEYYGHEFTKKEFTPQVINAGYCDIWAEQFVKRNGGKFVDTDMSDGKSAHGHSFVKYKEKYYDAETTQGVTNPLDLPYFKRVKSRMGGDWDEKKALSLINGIEKSDVDSSDVKTGYSVIDSILTKAEPIINDRVEKLRKYMKSKDLPFTDRDEKYYRLDLVSSLTNALSKYVKKTDSLDRVNITTEKGVVVIDSSLIRDGRTHYLGTQMIGAGGHNIQQYHYRYLVDTRLPQIINSDASKPITEKIKTMKKEDKLLHEVDHYKKLIERQDQKISDLKSKSDEDVWKNSTYYNWKWNPGGSISESDFPAWKENLKKDVLNRHKNEIGREELQKKLFQKELEKWEKKLQEHKSSL